MVSALVEKESSARDEMVYLKRTLPILDREYKWWMRTGPKASAVKLEVDAAYPCILNRYIVDSHSPRPESWRDDMNAAQSSSLDFDVELFSEIAAAAESGWDFSSRWLGEDDSDDTPCFTDVADTKGRIRVLRKLRTSKIIPVDLNAILFRNEATLAHLHSRHAELESSFGTDEEKLKIIRASAEFYRFAAESRATAIRSVLWNPNQGMWNDYDLAKRQRRRNRSAASYTPLWAGCFSVEEAELAVKSLEKSGLIQIGGVASTLPSPATREQWDWPNVWPPLQHMIIEGLGSCDASGAAALAENIAVRWLRNCHVAWLSRGCMDEKQDATNLGQRGGGGEYEAQVGFGWTNGVVLHLLQKYGRAFSIYLEKDSDISSFECVEVETTDLDVTPPYSSKVVIVGGGIAGLAAAIALQRAGIRTVLSVGAGREPSDYTNNLVL